MEGETDLAARRCLVGRGKESNSGATAKPQQGDNNSIQGLVQVPKAVILTQVINHATEHRAQIMAILTQLGIQPPELDSWGYFEAHALL